MDTPPHPPGVDA